MDETPKKINWIDKQNETGVWYTPRQILDPTDMFFGGKIPYDPATNPLNPTQALNWTSDINGGDGLETNWAEESQEDGVFVNPPYGKKNRFHDWIAKIHHEAENGTRIIALLPCGARFSTKYWQAHALVEELDALLFVKKRVPFLNADGKECKNNPYDSAIYAFNVDPRHFYACFGHLGKCFQTQLLQDPLVIR